MSIVLSVVLWVVAVAATVWVLTPAREIAFALSIGGVRTAVLADVGPPSVYGDQAVFDERMRELAALGYRDAARTRETALFMLPYLWRWRQFETTRWLVGPDGRTHATLSRLLRDEPPRIAFITLFDNGAIVRTTCPGTGGRMPSTPNYRVKELLGVTASELLAAHEQQVAVFAQERGVLVARAGVDGRVRSRPLTPRSARSCA